MIIILTFREMEVCSQLIESLFQICENLIKMHENSANGNLYSKEYSHDNLITRGAKVINQVVQATNKNNINFVIRLYIL